MSAVHAGTHGRTRRAVRRGWYVLLLVQFVAVLVPDFYTRTKPEAWGIPFFYWYQFAWIIISALLTGLVYVITTRSDEEPAGHPGDGA